MVLLWAVKLFDRPIQTSNFLLPKASHVEPLRPALRILRTCVTPRPIDRWNLSVRSVSYGYPSVTTLSHCVISISLPTWLSSQPTDFLTTFGMSKAFCLFLLMCPAMFTWSEFQRNLPLLRLSFTIMECEDLSLSAIQLPECAIGTEILEKITCIKDNSSVSTPVMSYFIFFLQLSRLLTLEILWQCGMN